MKTIHTMKAKAATERESVETLTICFNQEVPSMGLTGEELLSFHRDLCLAEGKVIVDALYEHLPTGLINAIFDELARRQPAVGRKEQ
jgi:hypothetical protein